MKDKKLCKGLGLAKGLGCGNNVLAKSRRKGLCNKCYGEFLYSDVGREEKAKFFIKVSKTVIQEKKEQKKVKDKKQKIESKSIAVLVQDAKVPFQKLIRIRDHRKQCICCDNILPFTLGDFDAGHYYSSESNKHLVFHPDNVHGQRKYCNQYLHGNESGYSNGLIIRIGWSRYQKLTALKNSRTSYKWDRTKLIELKEHYKKELRLVEKGEKDISEVDFSIGIIK